MTHWFLASVAFAALLFSLPARAQAPGTVDATFETGSTLDNFVRVVADAGEGKVYVGGDFTSMPGAVRSRVARLNTDGTVDTTFAQTGTGLNNSVYELVVQPDGKVLVGGSFTSYNGTSRNRIARLNADGTLDTSFAPNGTGLNGPVYSLAVQADGKVLVGGDFTNHNGIPSARIARLNSNGALDLAFAQTGAGLNNQVNSLALQPDGKVLVGGIFTAYNGTTRARLARLNSDGTLDTSFDQTGTGLNNTLISLALQPDGRLLVGGSFTTYDGVSRPYMTRLNADGSLDTSFAPTGSGLNDAAYAIVLQPDGKVLVGGRFFTYNGASRSRIARVNADGTLDTTFTSTGGGLNNPVDSVALQADGRVLLAGDFTTYGGNSRLYMARLNSNGGLDTSFAPATGTGLNKWVDALAQQPDGKVLVGGGFTTYDGASLSSITRFNADGSRDPSFALTGIGLNNTVNAIALQPDGKVIAGGLFFIYNGTSRPHIARLNANGTLDTSFAQTGTGLSSMVTSLALQADGKVIVGGFFTNYNGTSRNRIARLNANGTLDTSFAQASTGFNGSVHSLALQPDGKVLVAGAFNNYNGTSRPYIARLNSDGTVDTTFAQTGTGLNAVPSCLALQADGKVLVGGSFTGYNVSTRNRLARLNADGTLDTTFTSTGVGLDGTVLSIALQADGKLLVGGYFAAYNSILRNRIARLNNNGSLDTGFNSVTGASSTVKGAALQADGRVLLGGDFGAYDGTPRGFLARAHNDSATQSLSATSTSRVQWLRGGSAPEVEQVSFERSADGVAWTSLGTGKRISGGWELTGLSLLRTGQVRARARATGGYQNGSSSVVEQVVSYSLPTVAEAWAQSHGVSADLSLPGANGQANVLNFGFGVDPNAGAGGALVYTGTFSGPVLTAPVLPGMPIVRSETPQGGMENRALFVRRKDHVEAGLTYGVEFSANLTTWQLSVTPPTVLADDGILQIVSVPFPPPINGQEARFFQVSVSLAP